MNKVREVARSAVNFIADNGIQVAETLLFLILIILILSAKIFSWSTLFLYWLIEKFGIDTLSPLLDSGVGGIIFLIILIVALDWFVREKINKDKVMNWGNRYHDYPYWWYLYCAKVLGFKQCSLIRVPIYMQFKLIVNDVFDNYPFDENLFREMEDESEIKIDTRDITGAGVINLILEDTYPIKLEQIPVEKRALPLIRISRNDAEHLERHYSRKFVEAVANQMRHLDAGVSIDVYATTNPKNTKYIVEEAFKMGGRGNISHLYVYQQSSENGRIFEPKGHKIY